MFVLDSKFFRIGSCPTKEDCDAHFPGMNAYETLPLHPYYYSKNRPPYIRLVDVNKWVLDLSHDQENIINLEVKINNLTDSITSQTGPLDLSVSLQTLSYHWERVPDAMVQLNQTFDNFDGTFMRSGEDTDIPLYKKVFEPDPTVNCVVAVTNISDQKTSEISIVNGAGTGSITIANDGQLFKYIEFSTPDTIIRNHTVILKKIMANYYVQ